MEKTILSLKNIYKLLMSNDFPIYSESVISKKQRKGQTLLRFWQNIMVRELCCLPYGKMIWRNDGTRNRYISNLCNRNEELKYYHEYARELGTQIRADVLLDQIRRFMEFLQDREYKHEILLYRVKKLIPILDEDPYVIGPIKEHLAQLLLTAEVSEQHGAQGTLFYAAYLLTVMSLYAAAGEAMNDPTMAVLRKPDFGVDALWEIFRQRQEHDSGEITILTAYAGLLQGNPLPKDHFFGREEALFDLREMAVSGRKCLISGIGGVGKTEMLRQLIRQCCEERIVDKLAIVQYQTDLAESMSRAFPEIHHQSREETFLSILHQLEKEAQDGKLLLLVDDVTNGIDTDSNIRSLAKLPCAVIMTSRRKMLEGFKVYELTMPTEPTSALIFRDNYGYPMSEEDRAELQDLLRNQGMCHPLTLRLMAKAARSKNWSVRKLRERLLRDGLALTWMEGDRTVRIEQMYTQLYSLNHIPQGCQEITELFTLLPHNSYDADFLIKTFPAVCAEESNLVNSLTVLTEGGWLERDDSGYSMHPLIAQCLRRKTLTQTRLENILSGLHRKLMEDPVNTEEHRRVCRILIYISHFLTGSICADLILDIMDAMRDQQPTRQLAMQYQKQLDKMLKRCPDRNDTVEIVWHTLLCAWSLNEDDAVEAVFRKQQARLTVPISRFLEFCIFANVQLFKDRPALAEEMLHAVLEADATAQQRASAYRELITLAEYRGDSEAALHWGEVGAAFVTQHPECGELHAFDNIAGLAVCYLKFGRGEAVKPLLDQMEKLEKSIAMPSVTVQYLLSIGTYELYYGDLENARMAVQNALELVEKCHGKNFNYYSTLNQLAIILQRQKRCEEAKAAYEEILSYGKGHVYFNIARNNYAVLLLDMGKTENALPYLTEVLSVARQQGGIALGEALRNMARAHGLLGEHAQEYEYLKEAVPLLEEAYGTEHPRPAAARERLKELAGQIE